MQKSKRVAILATVLLLLPLELLILVGMWPYLPLVGKAFAGMLITFCVCGAVYAVALTYQRITAPRLIVERDVVVMLSHDGYTMVSQGKSQEAVAKACSTNQTYVSRLVRRYKEQHNMD